MDLFSKFQRFQEKNSNHFDFDAPTLFVIRSLIIVYFQIANNYIINKVFVVLSPFSWTILLLNELLVQLRFEKAAEGILLHQGVDAALSQVKGSRRKVNQVPQSQVFGEMVNVHLKKKKNAKALRMLRIAEGI